MRKAFDGKNFFDRKLELSCRSNPKEMMKGVDCL